MSQNVVLAGAVRTPLAKFGGSLATTPAVELGTVVVKEALARAGVPADAVDEVIMGSVLQAGTGQNIARQIAVKAGLPISTPGFTINKVCGSGLKAVNLAAALIMSGEADVVVVGGTENMSQAPYLLKQARFGYRLNDSVLVDSMQSEGLSDAFEGYAMGVTAENVAAKVGISRAEQDEFAARSQQRAELAISSGRFVEEIVPVEVQSRKGTVVFDTDEAPRFGSTVDTLGKLKPVFVDDGTVTAGNSSGISDGAAAMVVMSEAKAKEFGVTPMAVWVGGASAGVDPALMGLGPVASTTKLLDKLSMSVGDLDLIELNEAFAAQAIGAARGLGLDMTSTNVNGGAIALGHPIGASGTRILVTLLHEMRRRQAETGLASLCIGGGMGVSALVRQA